MNLRLTLYELIERYELDAARGVALFGVAGLTREPASLARGFRIGVGTLAAALGGFGLVLWVAANWQDFGRAGRFALLQGVVAAMGIGAAFAPRLRAPLALAALLGIGALFAYYGQTYQTGADPWQLFALWAALSLPLCMAGRSDVLWAPWALVAATAISLWVHAHIGHAWRVRPGDTTFVYAVAWAAFAALAGFLSGGLRAVTGAGPWSLRTAATLGVVTLTIAGAGALFSATVPPQYLLSLGLFVAAAGVLSQRRWFDVFLLSAVALAIDVLVVAGLVRAVSFRSGEMAGDLMLIGLAAAAVLAISVNIIMRLARRHG